MKLTTFQSGVFRAPGKPPQTSPASSPTQANKHSDWPSRNPARLCLVTLVGKQTQHGGDEDVPTRSSLLRTQSATFPRAPPSANTFAAVTSLIGSFWLAADSQSPAHRHEPPACCPKASQCYFHSSCLSRVFFSPFVCLDFRCTELPVITGGRWKDVLPPLSRGCVSSACWEGMLLLRTEKRPSVRELLCPCAASDPGGSTECISAEEWPERPPALQLSHGSPGAQGLVLGGGGRWWWCAGGAGDAVPRFLAEVSSINQ